MLKNEMNSDHRHLNTCLCFRSVIRTPATKLLWIFPLSLFIYFFFVSMTTLLSPCISFFPCSPVFSFYLRLLFVVSCLFPSFHLSNISDNVGIISSNAQLAYFSSSNLTLCVPCINWNVLINNEMHSSYNHFLFHSFLSAVHVSNEFSRSSSVARQNILYYTVQSVQSVQSCRRV